jgi:hypothetical protein
MQKVTVDVAKTQLSRLIEAVLSGEEVVIADPTFSRPWTKTNLRRGRDNPDSAPARRPCLIAETMDWAHRDPLDRLLAASALRRHIPIVSADPAFDAILPRIW